MRIEILNDRIQNAESKIEKKSSTVIKKEALIAKKESKIKTLGFDPYTDKYEVNKKSNEAYWLMCDIDWLQDDIKRGRREIEETKATLENYRQQLAGEIEKESILLKDIPESMKRMQIELVERWDAWDVERRNRMKDDYRTLGWKEFNKKYRSSDVQFKDKTDEQIHDENMMDAKVLILDLYYRVKNITGKITDWSNVHDCQGACGMNVLNGFVLGKEGRAEIESILAGGYNIQRLHIRVLVKEFK
ncbi:MAG: hypothetical protein VB118_03185 [Oscillospiraceae bacterium]|nr:hypothetical protein [Oscillospiraceae bacterium]